MKNDNRSEEEIRKVIEWIFSQEEGFWKKSIPRPKFLRKWFDDAFSQMNEKPKMSIEEKNIEYVKSLIKINHGMEEFVFICLDHLEVATKNVLILKFKENGFVDQLQSHMRKENMVKIIWPK